MIKNGNLYAILESLINNKYLWLYSLHICGVDFSFTRKYLRRILQLSKCGDGDGINYSIWSKWGWDYVAFCNLFPFLRMCCFVYTKELHVKSIVSGCLLRHIRGWKVKIAFFLRFGRPAKPSQAKPYVCCAVNGVANREWNHWIPVNTFVQPLTLN